MSDVVKNYVKFMRGTPTAFKNLATKDDDTLYFLSDKDNAEGYLYLGTKLISEPGSGSLTNLSLSKKKYNLLMYTNIFTHKLNNHLFTPSLYFYDYPLFIYLFKLFKTCSIHFSIISLHLTNKPILSLILVLLIKLFNSFSKSKYL